MLKWMEHDGVGVGDGDAGLFSGGRRGLDDGMGLCRGLARAEAPWHKLRRVVRHNHLI